MRIIIDTKGTAAEIVEEVKGMFPTCPEQTKCQYAQRVTDMLLGSTDFPKCMRCRDILQEQIKSAHD